MRINTNLKFVLVKMTVSMRSHCTHQTILEAKKTMQLHLKLN